ncbi:MAG: DUF5908 family protein [Bacteroidota bacterium]
MAIEIKELIIKTTVLPGNEKDKPTKPTDEIIEEIKDELMKECRDLVEELLNRRQSRF